MGRRVHSGKGKSAVTIHYRYGGASMAPTLRASDLLRVVPYGDRKIRAGDAVVFRSPGGDRLVVHRVVSTGPGGIATRGDNNLHGDPWLLSPDRIIGRVASIQRAKRERRIYGGFAGRMRALSCRAVLRVKSKMISVLRAACRGFVGSGVLGRLLPPGLSPRVFVFERSGRRQMRLIMGRRAVGGVIAGQNRWRIRTPFRPFCDPASLPPVPSGHGHGTR